MTIHNGEGGTKKIDRFEPHTALPFQGAYRRRKWGPRQKHFVCVHTYHLRADDRPIFTFSRVTASKRIYVDTGSSALFSSSCNMAPPRLLCEAKYMGGTSLSPPAALSFTEPPSSSLPLFQQGRLWNEFSGIFFCVGGEYHAA